jgi:CheY-like chemotaxis protein
VYFTEFNPAELITDIYRMFSHPDMNKGLEIKALLPEEYKDLIIRSDANKVRQILTNLTSNAVKYTFEGGVRLGFELHKDQIEFFVKDTGIGIPEKERLHIFETFYRGEQALSCAIRGTGLGLNIAKELVGVIGGTIGVDSVVDNGSRFYFTLPLKEVRRKNQEHHSRLTKFKKLADFTILITDDEPINSQYLEAILKGVFKKIDHARNGKDAIEMVLQNKYDLILMDLKMPVMGGIEATKIIREQFPDIPIIAQTAYSLPEERDVALAAGCNEFISKPIKKEALMMIINKYVSNYR